jgi:hypothetical protein
MISFKIVVGAPGRRALQSLGLEQQISSRDESGVKLRRQTARQPRLVPLQRYGALNGRPKLPKREPLKCRASCENDLNGRQSEGVDLRSEGVDLQIERVDLRSEGVRLSSPQVAAASLELALLCLLLGTNWVTTGSMGELWGSGEFAQSVRQAAFLLVETAYVGLHVWPLAPLLDPILSWRDKSQATDTSAWMRCYTAAHFFASECALLCIVLLASPISSELPAGVVCIHLAFHILYTLITLVAPTWAVQQNVKRVQVSIYCAFI